KMLDLLFPRHKRQLYYLCAAMVIMAVLEMVYIASIMPFMSVVANPEVVNTNRWMKQIYAYFQFTSVANFLVFLGMPLLVITICSNLFKALYTWWALRYNNQLNYMLARRLLAQ